LVGGRVVPLLGWLVGWLVGWSVVLLVCGSVGWFFFGRLVGCLVGWFGVCVIGWLSAQPLPACARAWPEQGFSHITADPGTQTALSESLDLLVVSRLVG